MRYFKYFGISSNLSLSVTISYFCKPFFLLSCWSVYSLNRCSTISEFLKLWIHFIRGKNSFSFNFHMKKNIIQICFQVSSLKCIIDSFNCISHSIRHVSLRSLGRLNKCLTASHKKDQGKIQYLYTHRPIWSSPKPYEILSLFL